jgi:hypothetical protein
MIARQEPAQHNQNGSGYCDVVREKFRTVFGSECTLPNECLMKRYAVTSTGDLIMILR